MCEYERERERERECGAEVSERYGISRTNRSKYLRSKCGKQSLEISFNF